MTAKIAAAVTLLATLGSGCAGDGDDHSSPVAERVYDCFEGGGMPEGAIAEGTIEIGTPRDEFELLTPEQELPLYAGIQGLFHFEMRTGILGMDGGEPDTDDVPVTMLNGYDDSGHQISIKSDPEEELYVCGSKLAYEPGDEYDVMTGPPRLLRFPRDKRPDDGERVRIVAEIVDRSGHYASNEVWVVARHVE